MPKAPIETGSPIKTFVEQTKDQVTAGLGDWELKGPIEFEMSTTVSGSIGGKLDIQVINFGSKVEAEQVQKIKISIGPRDILEEQKKKAIIEEIRTRSIANLST